MSYNRDEPLPGARRRSWLIFVPAAIVAVLAVAWSGLWFYAAARAQTAMAGWLDREARLGRIYTCGAHSVGGFPFRIEVRCDNASAELRALQPPVLASKKPISCRRSVRPTGCPAPGRFQRPQEQFHHGRRVSVRPSA